MTAMLFEFPASAPITLVPKKKPLRQGYTGEYLAFWALYPPRFNSSKFLAFKAWNKLDEDEHRQAMIAAPVYAASRRGKDEEYTAHAATWLNGKYFETIAQPRVQPQITINIDWPAVLKIYAKTNNWNTAYGQPPGTADCRCPKEILAQYGYL